MKKRLHYTALCVVEFSRQGKKASSRVVMKLGRGGSLLEETVCSQRIP